MLHASFDLREPKLKWSLDTLRTQILKKLHEKLQIEVRDSAQLYGVCDETDTLEEEEVFINLPERLNLTGRKILVGKNPAYAPGDLRVFTVVDRPHLRACPANCIVFASSQRCGRSPADTMSGGDLDGDLFFVCWDPSLIPDYPAAPQPRPKGPLQPAPARLSMREEAARTFLALRNKMLLGQLSNEWKETAEASPALANDPYCLALVPLIEQALDMAKTGDDVDALRTQFRRTRFGLGRARRGDGNHLEPLRTMIPLAEKASFEHWKCDLDLDLRPTTSATEWSRFITEGFIAMRKFNAELAKAIDVDSSADVSGNGAQQRQAASGDKWARSDEVHNNFISEYFSGTTPKERGEETVRASAWYVLGYSQEKKAFAWLGLRYLCRLKAVAQQRGGEVVSVGPLTIPLVPSAHGVSSVPSNLGESWNVVSRTNSIESLGSDDRRPPLEEVLLTCMTLGHAFSMKADATMRQFKCATCHENRVERLQRA